MTKVITKFWGDGCLNCRALSPIVAGVAKKYPDIEFREINSKDTDATKKYEITTLPTLIFEKDGAEVGRMMGLRPESLIVKKIAEVF